MDLRSLFRRSVWISQFSVGLCIAALVLVPLVNVSRGQDRSAAAEIAPEGCTPIVEGFTSIAGLPAAGWSVQNLSSPLGTTSWLQPTATSPFTAHEGATTSYAAANFQNGGGLATISNWLISPQIDLANGQQMSFWTRTTTPGAELFPDRLQVRLSTAGASTTVGPGATGLGDFTTLLLDINPTYSTDYPSIWTQFTVTVAGLGAPTSGRFAFRYFVENSGPSGLQGDFIGVDTVNIGCPASQSSGSISGRVVDQAGRGLSNIPVTITGGASPQVVRTSTFGYFRFDSVPLNVQYTIGPAAKLYAIPSQQVTPSADVTGMVFTGTPNP